MSIETASYAEKKENGNWRDAATVASFETTVVWWAAETPVCSRRGCAASP